MKSHNDMDLCRNGCDMPAVLCDGCAGDFMSVKQERDRYKAALEVAKETLASDGCDCGTDEPGSCALCVVKAALKGHES